MHNNIADRVKAGESQNKIAEADQLFPLRAKINISAYALGD
jgi:hypothetical protein